MSFRGGRRIFAWTAALGVSCALLLAGAGGAIATAASPGSGPNAAALKALGLQITWPLNQSATTVAPGRRLSVAVRNLRHGDQRTAVQLTLEQTTSTGQVVSTVASRRLYQGTVVFVVPSGAGRDYTLALAAGPVGYSAVIETAAASGEVPPLGVTTTTGSCTETASAPTPNPVPAGAQMSVTIANSGSGDCDLGAGVNWEQDVNGQWVAAPAGDASCGVATPDVELLLPPGHSTAISATVPDWFATGAYRVRFSGSGYQEVQVTADPNAALDGCGGASATP